MKHFYISLILIVLICAGKVAYTQRLKAHTLSRDDSASVILFKGKIDSFGKENDSKSESYWMNRLARLYWDHNMFEDAAVYYEKSLKINERLGNENGIAMINSNLGLIYTDMLAYAKAKKYFQATLAARRSKKEKVGMISALINISVVLNNLKQYNESAEYLEEALVLAKEVNNPEQIKSCYGMLSDTYRKAGNSQQAREYFELYKTFHEMVQEVKIGKVRSELENQRLKAKVAEMEKRNKELEILAKNEEIREKDSTNQRLTKTLTKREMQLQIVNQQAEIAKLKAKEQDLALADEQRKKILVYIILGVVMVLLFVAYRINRKIRKTNKQLEEQNTLIRNQQGEIIQKNSNLEKANKEIGHKRDQIKASINYASMIQSASLHHEVELHELLPNSFIFFRPKDVVSGDFYWYNKVDDLIIVAAIDCTGHGVPGGFMSMVANNILSDIIMNKGILEPVKILEHADEGVRIALNQCHSGNNDGMDMALCIIDEKNGLFRFGGAKNPMVLIRDNEFVVVPASKRSIGGCNQIRLRPFEQQEVPMGKDNTFYLFSDGFQDQFGGAKDRKFGTKRFKQLLMDNHKKPFDKQSEILEGELLSWKGERFQVDDLLVIGVNVEKK